MARATPTIVLHSEIRIAIREYLHPRNLTLRSPRSIILLCEGWLRRSCSPRGYWSCSRHYARAASCRTCAAGRNPVVPITTRTKTSLAPATAAWTILAGWSSHIPAPSRGTTFHGSPARSRSNVRPPSPRTCRAYHFGWRMGYPWRMHAAPGVSALAPCLFSSDSERQRILGTPGRSLGAFARISDEQQFPL